MDTGFNRDNEIRNVARAIGEIGGRNYARDLLDDIESVLSYEIYDLILIKLNSEEIPIKAEDVGSLGYAYNNKTILTIKIDNTLRFIPINRITEIKFIEAEN